MLQRRQQLLLVLDNCEHVIGAAAALCAGLLAACDDVRVLATSREPLAVAGVVAVVAPQPLDHVRSRRDQPGPALPRSDPLQRRPLGLAPFGRHLEMSVLLDHVHARHGHVLQELRQAGAEIAEDRVVPALQGEHHGPAVGRGSVEAVAEGEEGSEIHGPTPVRRLSPSRPTILSAGMPTER